MDAAIETLDATRHALDLLDTWQAKVLRAARGELSAVVLSVLAHNFDDAMPVLLRLVYPGFTAIRAPFFCSAGKVAKTGHVMADLVDAAGRRIQNFAIFKNKKQMETAFRRLADQVKLDDNERTELFAALRNWVVCDYRLDPTMSPADPDARRLVVN